MNELLRVNIFLIYLQINSTTRNSQHTLNSPWENECKGNINTARNWKLIWTSKLHTFVKGIRTCMKEIILLLLRIKICSVSLMPFPPNITSFEVFLKTKFNQTTSIIIYISFNLKVVSWIINQSHLKYQNLQAFIQLAYASFTIPPS
jgi:hypothetical protein